MPKKTGNPVEDAWNATRGDGVEFAETSPDFRAKLQQVYGAALAGQPESGIAGLEKFEAEIRKGVKETVTDGVPEAGAPASRDAASVALAAEEKAETTPKGSGAQEGSEEKALKDAAAAGSRVENDEVNSPSFPSAARPLAAEAPGNAPDPDEAKAASKKRSKAAAKSGKK